MKERPILFSGPMIKVILEGRKTQTRRVIKFRFQGDVSEMARHKEPFTDSPKGDLSWSADHKSKKGVLVEQDIRCPYGKPGDQLWVRETWAVAECYNDLKPTELPLSRRNVAYLADGEPMLGNVCGRTRSPIFMPRWAGRILLEVTDVRVERLQDISEEDAEAEGIEINLDSLIVQACREDFVSQPYRLEFCKLWNSINQKRGYGWSENHWVWVVEFKRIDG